ncbi:MAG TPA: hypothetical protein VNJ71_10475 [Gemmatimonadales bacterium]|nr:hypothetical protein [Gemmatimonadales bacterium]
MSPAWIGCGTAALTALLVGLIRQYALRTRLLDLPGPRASHRVPTPRGGGLAPASLLAATLAWAAFEAPQEREPLGPAALGLALVAAVGWRDDRRALSVGARLGAHLVAGALLLPLALQIPESTWASGALGALWWLVWAVSAVNVVNFMDGIDGLVGSQMAVFGIHLALLGRDPTAHAFGAVLAGAALGFLCWNWAPARIFLGDVGSGSLGLAAAIGGMLAIRSSEGGVMRAFLPLYPMFLDATITLLRRLGRGEPIHLPHRTHLYQRLANDRGWGHARVSLLYAAAALAGVAAVHVPSPPLHGVAIGAYAIGVLALGWALDRGGGA